MASLKLIDLIKNEDFDYVSVRQVVPEISDDIFIGAFQSKSGEIISLDCDTYKKDMLITKYECWSDEDNDIKNGLTIWVEEFSYMVLSVENGGKDNGKE